MASELATIDAEDAERLYREAAGVNTIKALFGDTSANYFDMPSFTAAQAGIVAPSFENLTEAEKRAILADDGALGYISSALDWAETQPTGVVPNAPGTGKGAMTRPPKGGVGDNPLEAFSQYIQSDPELAAQFASIDQGSINTLANYLESGGIPQQESDDFVLREYQHNLDRGFDPTPYLGPDAPRGWLGEDSPYSHASRVQELQNQLDASQAPWGRWDELGFDPLTPSNPLEQIGYDPAALKTRAETARAERDKQYQGVFDTLMEEFNRGRGQQRTKSGANLKLEMVRRGLTGGSAEADLMGELSRLDLEAAGDLTGRAQSARERLASADDSLMQQLVGEVKAGGDVGAATQAATSGMTSQYNQEIDQGRAALNEDIFASLDDLFGQQQYVEGRKAARKTGGGGVVTPGVSGSGYSGTIVG